MSCGHYMMDWTDECRKPGCERCSKINLGLQLPPAGCICDATTEIGGYVYQTTLTRHEKCPHHGRCHCGSGKMYWDDHREVDCWDREWRKECPLLSHRP